MPSTITVSWSEINNIRKCPKLHELAYIDRWEQPPDSVSPGLARGTYGHSIFELHYQALRAVQRSGDTDAAAPYRDRIEALLGARDPQQTEEQALMEWIYRGYLAQYDPLEEAQRWEILAVEHPAEVWLPTPTGGRSRFKLKLKVDIVIRIGRRIWVVDNKFLKDLPNDRTFEFDDQFGLYTWALRRLGHKVHGSLYNACRTFRHKDEDDSPHPLDERFKRTLLYRTDIELENIALEAYETVRSVYGAGATHPRHPDAGPFGCRGCSYLEPCLAGRKGMDETQLLIAKGFRVNRERH